MSRLELTQQQTTPLPLEGVQTRVAEHLQVLHLIPAEVDETQQDELRQHEDTEPNGWQKTEIVTNTEENIAKRALEKARVLVNRKAQAFSYNARRVGTIAAASLAATGGYAAVQEITDKLPAASAAEVDYGTGGYPWAHLTPGTSEVDGNGFPIRDCTSWVGHKLKSTGRDPARVFNSDITGEIIDKNPAIGAAANTADGRHVMYVEDVTNTHITVSDYNGIGGPYKYGIETLPRTHPEVQSWTYTHFELPDPRSPEEKAQWNNNDSTENESSRNTADDIYANLKKINRNIITAKRPIREGSFLESKGGQYRLVVNKGDVKLRDTEANDKVKWSVKTNERATRLQIKLGKGKQRGKNTLAFSDGKKDYKKLTIGPATKIELGVDGELVGYKGKNVVWQAKTIRAVPRVAKLSMSKIASKRAKALGR